MSPEEATRTVLDFADAYPYTGLADAPKEVRQALRVLRDTYPKEAQVRP